MSSTADFLEIDFLAVETDKSGDAITARYTVNGITYIHVTDGGFSDTGEAMVQHLATYYSNQSYVDHAVLTHPDQDHASGLRYVLENYDAKNLWMNRPWLYSTELIGKFKNYTDTSRLASALKAAYPLVLELEEIANRRGTQIHEAFQGSAIGAFIVMSPSKSFYLRKIVESTRTPEPAPDDLAAVIKRALYETGRLAKAAARFVTAKWGDESLPDKPTSAENETSVIQFIEFGGFRFLLTGDAGREALQEFVNYAPYVGLTLPGIHKFQVPHHGSRRNVSSELLDKILGSQLSAPAPEGAERFTAIISSALKDADHPKRAVERAIHHRGGKVLATEGESICTGYNRPKRNGWQTATSRPYPTEQEQ
jgi:beta-lactamase superfamily II metal-dependent hydrolase